MARAWRVGAVLIGAVLAGGCPDGGPPKRELAKPVDDANGAAPAPTPRTKLTKPAKTDPDAEAVIDRLLNAHTDGKPAALEKLKTLKSVRKGRFEGPGPAVWTVQAVWPDKFRQHTELAKFGAGHNITALSPNGGWKLLPSQGMTQPVPLTAAELTAFRTDIFGEWMSLLVPLADPAGRVAAPVPAPADDPKVGAGVRVWVRENAPVVLRTDAASGHLARIEYDIPDPSGAVPIVIAFLERKATDGVLLPTKSTYTVNKNLVSAWDAAEYEFPVSLSPELFEKP